MHKLTIPFLSIFLSTAAFAADPVPSVRVYAVDCGRADFKDMGFFTDTGELDGKKGSIVDPCFVIRHPKGTLIWDLGLGDNIAAQKGGVDVFGGAIHLTVDHTLPEQLKEIGLTAADINFLGFSHFHFDHTGNANEFPGATWIVNKTELAWATSTPPPATANPDSISGVKTAKTQMIDGDYDVFGDGTVRIIKAPGHTPGHAVLLITMKKSGALILSGDLYHTRDNRKFSRMPGINTDRADTLASMNRVEALVKSHKARFIIQHDAEDLKTLPKFPAYLE